MKFYHFIFFIIIDTIIHYFLVKWEVKTNKELFIDLELRPLFKINKK